MAAVRSAPPSCAWVTPTTNASRHQAVTSSAAAQARAITPSGVVLIPRSMRIRARTGNAVTDIETPRNSAKTVKGTSDDESRG